MTTDLWMLTFTALLCLGIPFIYGAGRFLQPGGVAWSASNRETELKVPAWTKRAVQAHMNLIENIGPFAIFVIVAHISGKANAISAMGSTIFFGARVLHLIVYVAGIVYLRTIIWFISWIGGILVLLQLFK